MEIFSNCTISVGYTELVLSFWGTLGLQALFTRDDDTSDEEEEDTDDPDMIAADELQKGSVSDIPSSKER